MDKKQGFTIAIDLGTDFTKVAFLLSNGKIHILDRWPGSDNPRDTEVPSRLVYHHNSKLLSWGFYCSAHDAPLPDGKIEHRFFKLCLDEVTCNEMSKAGLSTIQNAAKASGYVTYYLKQIYRHVKATYGKMVDADWTNAEVTFLFSIPAVWSRLDTIYMFKAAIRAADFGTEGYRHSVQVNHTEAEASAIDTLKSGVVAFRSGDIFLAVDSGAATTDLSLVEVTCVEEDQPQMSQVAEVSGIRNGSVDIDIAFRKLVEERLAQCPDVSLAICSGLAENMMNSEDFAAAKHSFGDSSHIDRAYWIKMPGLPDDFEHSQLRANRGCMRVDGCEMRALFDQQVNCIVTEVSKQMDWVVNNERREKVIYIALSGGFGSCKHVERRVEDYFAHRGISIKFIVSKEPRAAVVRGLLQNRKQELKTPGTPAMASYVARISYGVVRQEQYDPTVHIGEGLEPDRFDAALQWADKQIKWLIIKGNKADPTEPIVLGINKRLGPGESTVSVTTQIVSSRNEPGVLPQSLIKAGVKRLCQVQSTLTNLTPEELVLVQKRGWYCFREGYKYYDCEFDVHLIVTPVDLRFELWFQGRKFSLGHDPIKVEWNLES